MAADLQTKAQLADAAKTLAGGFGLIQRVSSTYIPVHWDTGEPAPAPAPEETIWYPMTREDKLLLANQQSGILFATDSEFRSFDFMLKQLAQKRDNPPEGILIRTLQGVLFLNSDGKLVEHPGVFTPNYIQPMLNDSAEDKEHVFKVIVEWLGGDEEEAHSLLHHLATALSPHYSAVKYVLLLGEGRNGKGVLLAMITALFGNENISNITRQMMAEKNPTVAELNNKLLNVIFDGEMAYIKDSSMEKTLIAGERGVVRMLYDSGTTPVQTNALYLEALNIEPKVRDKSPALQKRLVRYRFPNVYEQDKAFHKKMTSERYVGALLSLLIDHYVREDEIADKLKLTKGSLDLQIEQVFLGSPLLQFLEHLYKSDPDSITKIEKSEMTVDSFLHSFEPWCSAQNMGDRTTADLVVMIKSAFDVGWKTVREGGTPKNRKTIRGLKPETRMALDEMKQGGDTDAQPVQEELVGD